MSDISNSADVIDSRDIVQRLDELRQAEADVADAEAVADDAQAAYDDAQAAYDDAIADESDADAEADALADVDAATDDLSDAEVDRDCCHDCFDVDDQSELDALTELESEADGAADWQHGETLIRDSYFEEYAEELANDCCDLPANAAWPLCHIDWEAAADALRQDYTCVDYDGVDYWIRA